MSLPEPERSADQPARGTTAARGSTPAPGRAAPTSGGSSGRGSEEAVVSDLRSPFPRRSKSIAASMVLVGALSLGAAIGMTSIAGFPTVARRLQEVNGPWLLASLGSVLLAFFGYRIAFDRVVWEHRPHALSRRERLGLVIAGFGAFVPRGGTAIDRYVIRVTGAPKRECDVRLASLQALEMVPITIGACASAWVALIVGGARRPPIGYDLPWAIGPLIGAPLALTAVHVFRHRLRDSTGWRYWAGVFLDGIGNLARLLGPGQRGAAIVGMTVFSAAETTAVWTAMAAFGFKMSIAGVILGYGVGYVLSRRSAPLGGAGIIDVALILALANARAPLSAAIAGTFAYRFFNLWCSMPGSLLEVSRVRQFVERYHLRHQMGEHHGRPVADGAPPADRRPR